ncbi:Homeobox protein Wariai [Apiospora sp. TS-2023a]
MFAATNIFASGCSKAEITQYLDTIFHTEANETHATVQTIFASDSPKLLPLLQVFLDNGWHPNQVLGPPQEVALHHVQCVRDLNILKLLLDHGADPTIARTTPSLPSPLVVYQHPWKAPVQRKVGDILDMAAKVGTTEAIDLLLAHGAKFEYGRALHCLIEFKLLAGVDVNSTRFEMAEHLVRNGEDINGFRDI